jgi:hypothetical protein
MPAAPRWQPRRHVVIPGQAPASAWASGKGGVGAWRTRPLRRLASCQRPTRLPVVAALRTHLPVPGRPSRQQGTSRVETRDLPGANPAPACCSYRDRVASVDRGGLLKLRFVLFGSNFQVAGVRRIIIRPECALLSRVRSGCSRTTHTSTAAAAGHARSKDPASDIARRQGAGTRIHNQVRAPHTHRSAHGHSAQGHPSLTSDVMPVASGPSGAI